MRNADTRAHQEWLRNVVRRSGLAPSALAEKAGLNATTLTRPHNNDDWAGTLSTATIAAVSRAVGIKPPGGLEPFVSGFNEPDVQPLEPPAQETAPPNKSGDTWLINSRVLEHAGYLPGDHAVVDLKATATEGDAVLAQVLNRTGGAETVMRIYEPPYLTARCTTPPKPILLDSERVAVLGVIVEAHRYRKAM